MSKMREPLFELRVGSYIIRPYKITQFVDEANRERERWEWLQDVNDSTLPHHIKEGYRFAFNELCEFAQSSSITDLSLGVEAQNRWNALYVGHPPRLLHSSSPVGQAIIAIKAQHGTDAAGLAYGIYTSQISANLWDPRVGQVLVLVGNPNLIKRSALGLATASDHTTWKNNANALLHEHEALLDDKLVEWDRGAASAQAAVKARLWKAARKFVANQNSIDKRVGQYIAGCRDAIGDIRAVESSYAEQMKLRASVKYWDEKADEHVAAQATAFRHLKNLLIWGSAVGTLGFSSVIAFMLNTPDVAVPVYLVISAALGTLLTLLFWVGRVLLRTYLTERRLGGDARERKVMTQTFLALIKEGGATEEDRLVILNALFRPSPALPTGDETAGGDIAIPALIARLMDQRLK